MCGIAGLVDSSLAGRDADLSRRALAMSDAIANRGPDSSGIWLDSAAGLAVAHRRLSIVDLSAAGAQPMVSADGRWVICYNGEIYNSDDIRRDPSLGQVAWRGHSDTETIVESVARRGVEATLDDMNGMFALALWDRRDRVLHLVRDRLGIKPLFVARSGEQCYFASELKTLTFGGLRERVVTAARALRSKGIKAGDRVVLMMATHPDHIILYLALAWIGAVNIELSTHLKPAGIQLQLEDADPCVFIVDHQFAQDAATATLGPVVDRIRLLVRNAPQMTPPSFETLSLEGAAGDGGAFPATLERVQAISYTSGTTGRPKGVVMTERYFQVGANSAAILAGARPGDVLFMWEPFYHIAAWMTVFISLQRGIPIALVERFSASRCWDQIRASGATLLHYLGGAMNILLRQPPQPNDSDNPIRVAWGAAAPSHSWRDFEARFGVVVREGYGISEAQNFTHLNLDGRLGSIGKPTAEFESWIEGDNGRKLAPREIGEIVVRAKVPGVTMQGYFGAPEKTAEVLKDGCVYTGDLGYQDEDGFFYFSGRKKDSLRRRGENVSAWEVERVVNAHPAVEESAVIGVASDIGEQDIRVFIKLASGEKLEPIDLIRWCERDLAYYQVPRYVDFVEEFPRGPTQRIRKNDLPVSLSGSWDSEAGHKTTRSNEQQNANS